MPSEPGATPHSFTFGLTDEERSILDAAICGERLSTIALRLKLGIRTVERRVADSFAKLGVGNLAEAARRLAAGRVDVYESAFRASPAAMVVGDRHGRIIAVNPAFCRIVDYSEPELLGLMCMELTHPADVAVDDEIRSRLKSNGGPFHVAKRFLSRRGEPVAVDFFVAAEKDYAVTVGFAVLVQPSLTTPEPHDER